MLPCVFWRGIGYEKTIKSALFLYLCLREIGNAKIGAAVGNKLKVELFGDVLILAAGLKGLLFVRSAEVWSFIAMSMKLYYRLRPDVAAFFKLLDHYVLARQLFVQSDIPRKILSLQTVYLVNVLDFGQS